MDILHEGKSACFMPWRTRAFEMACGIAGRSRSRIAVEIQLGVWSLCRDPNLPELFTHLGASQRGGITRSIDPNPGLHSRCPLDGQPTSLFRDNLLQRPGRYSREDWPAGIHCWVPGDGHPISRDLSGKDFQGWAKASWNLGWCQVLLR